MFRTSKKSSWTKKLIYYRIYCYRCGFIFERNYLANEVVKRIDMKELVEIYQHKPEFNYQCPSMHDITLDISDFDFMSVKIE